MIIEKERIESLKSYYILDTLPEKDYDEITSLAAKAFKCPISYISFLDEERLWIKSSHGIPKLSFEKDFSFCQYTLNSDDIFIVNNTLKDERFHDNPYVIGNPKILFYAAVPIVSATGFNIGALCILDRKENQFSDSQLMYLKFLANKIYKLLELRRKKILLTKGNEDSRSFSKNYLKNDKKYSYQNKISHFGKKTLDKTANHETNKQMAFNFVTSNDISSDIQIVENTKKINSFCSTIEKEFSITKKINFSKYFHTDYKVEKAQFIAVNELISAVLNLYKDKMSIYEIQLDITSNIPPNYKIECKPSLTIQIISCIIHNSIESIKFKKFKWIYLDLKESSYDFEISISDNSQAAFNKFNMSNPDFQNYEMTNENISDLNNINFEGKNYLNKITNAIGAQVLLDKSCENSKVVFYLPKRNYQYDN
ncbi:GAF domain-containing protein [Silvanigrella sp.]|jgi:hypothetical protein|uniref:GAF domain-containing protein n=1 Tax=Silvanigrella sp. TaxID=2024976 RepID=UPI0037CC02B1